MKTARERAQEVLAIIDDGDLTTDAALYKITLAFKEYARDQRHICAEAAMNAPFPGEGRQ